MMPSYLRATAGAASRPSAEEGTNGAWGNHPKMQYGDESPAATTTGPPLSLDSESVGLTHSSNESPSKDTDSNQSPSGAAQSQQPNVHILIKNTFIQFEDPSNRGILDEALALNRPRGESCDAVLYTQNIKERCGCRLADAAVSQLLCIPEYSSSPVELRALEEDDTETPSKSSETTAADNEDSESQPSSAEGREKHVFSSDEPNATPRRQNRQRNSNYAPSSRGSQEVSPAELMESLNAFEQTKRMPLEDLPMPSHDKTTIMLRNIPNKYTQAMLLEAVNQDFRGLYDFFYLPIDFKNKCNVGYAFINFIHPYYAELFSTKFAGLKLTAFKSKKICEVSWGRVQGLRANIEHYRNSAIMSIPNSQYKPLIFKDGVPLQFPGPAGPIPSVKPRHGRSNHPTPQQA